MPGAQETRLDELTARLAAIAHASADGEAAADILQATDLLQRFQAIYRHITGKGPFICGYGGDVEHSSLPEFLHVCPEYGTDVVGIYKKVNEGAPGY